MRRSNGDKTPDGASSQHGSTQTPHSSTQTRHSSTQTPHGSIRPQHADAAHQIEAEQQAVNAMYTQLDALTAAALADRERVLAAPAGGPQELFARDVAVNRLTGRIAELRAADDSLCFGRIDHTAGEFAHIGRIGLRSPTGAPHLVDWRADAARPFYAATPASPLGVRRRRHLRLAGRMVEDVSDEILDGSAPTREDVVGDGPLVAALDSARTGRMREAVATLQAEQDAIVRSPHRGVLVVDGGPGTGKTIVSLHRAAYVLYAFPGLAESGVLIFGPNRRFLDYISDVLPSLGENDVRMATLADLVGTEPAATDTDAIARRKGSAEAAVALAQWVRGMQPRGSGLTFKVGTDTVTLDPRAVDAAHRHATNDGLSHNQARDVFKEFVVADLVTELERRTTAELTAMDEDVSALLGMDLDRAVAKDLRALGFDDTVTTTAGPEVDWEAIHDQLLDDPAVDQVIEGVWPRLDSGQVLRKFLTDHRVRVAFHLPDAERLVPEAPGGSRGAPEAGLTAADLALLDEVRELVDGPPEQVFGHIVVDEAQELSEMQWRMLMRRCPARSFTIVGDFAQSGTATTIGSWAEAVGPFVGEKFVHHRLTVNYRTTAEILDESAPLLARIAPDQQLSRSIRHGEHPQTINVDAAELDAALRDLVVEITAAAPDELIGVVGPLDRVDLLGTVLDGTGAVVVAAPDVRGLEFDAVIIVDPDAIQDRGEGGIRDLYVALTRATKRAWTLRLLPDVEGLQP